MKLCKWNFLTKAKLVEDFPCLKKLYKNISHMISYTESENKTKLLIYTTLKVRSGYYILLDITKKSINIINDLNSLSRFEWYSVGNIFINVDIYHGHVYSYWVVGYTSTYKKSIVSNVENYIRVLLLKYRLTRLIN